MAAKGSKFRGGRAKGTKPEADSEARPADAGLEASSWETGPDRPPIDGESANGPDAPVPSDEERFRPEEEVETVFGPTEPVESGRPNTAGRPASHPQTWRVSNLLVGGLAVILVAAALAGVVMFTTGRDPGRLDQHAQRLDAVAAEAQMQTSRLDRVEEGVSGLEAEMSRVTGLVGGLENSLDELRSAVEANRQTLDRLTQGIEEMESAVAVRAGNGEAGEAVGELRGTIELLDERLASLEQGDGIDDLTGRVARLEEDIAGLRDQTAASIEQGGDIGELTGRIARLEEDIAGLRDQTAASIEQGESASALSRAYAALSGRLAAGAPFAEELEQVTAELPGAPGLEALRPHSVEGVATIPDLRSRLAEIAAALPGEDSGGGAAAEADGVWQTMRQRVEGMVTVSRADEADRPELLKRAGEALDRGDVEAAIAAVEQVGEASSAELDDWLADARARTEAQSGLDELSEAVLRQFVGRR